MEVALAQALILQVAVLTVQILAPVLVQVLVQEQVLVQQVGVHVVELVRGHVKTVAQEGVILHVQELVKMHAVEHVLTVVQGIV